MIGAMIMGAAVFGCVWWGIDWLETAELAARVENSIDPSRKKTAHVSRRHLVHFPDFLELTALGLSAGLTLDQSWAMALAALPNNQLSGELRNFQRAVEMGRSRGEAIRELAGQLVDPQIKMVLALLAQSMRSGNGLQEVLIDQARALRQNHLADMERRAQTAGLRMLFPIFVFILPTVFLVLFAPLVIRLSQGMSLF